VGGQCQDHYRGGEQLAHDVLRSQEV
jgi:hypothetical protein